LLYRLTFRTFAAVKLCIMKTNFIQFLTAFMLISAPMLRAGNDVVLENGQFKLVVGSNAIPKSLIIKSSGEECLRSDATLSLCTATQERPYNNEVKLAHLNKRTTYQADTIYWKDKQLIVGFETIPYEAVIGVKMTPQYMSFTLDGFIVESSDYAGLKLNTPPAVEVCLMQLPVRERTYFGEWLNVCWDKQGAVNLLATDPYCQISAEKREGYRVLRSTAVKGIKLKGAGAALLACPSDRLLDGIAKVEEDFNLPRGVESRRGPKIDFSYFWTMSITPSNADSLIRVAKQFGFPGMLMYYPSFCKELGAYQLVGEYEWKDKDYPNHEKDLSKMLDKIKAAGIIPGFHTLHSQIGMQTHYVTPVPDYRMSISHTYNLSRNLGIDDTEVYVEQNPEDAPIVDKCRVLKVGTEFITYEKFTTEPPYKFIGCKRAYNGTKAQTAPQGMVIGTPDISEFSATSIYVNQQSSLEDELAAKAASFYNLGFQFMYLDGSEGVNPPFDYNVPFAQYNVIRRLHLQPIFVEGAARGHFSWHYMSGGNAFDTFVPEEQKAAVRRYQLKEAPQMQADFTRLNFGWMAYTLPSDKTIGTQPDILEFVTSKAAAWDCPISMKLDPQKAAAHPRTADNAAVVKAWEDVRARHWLTDAQKEMLKNPDAEFILLTNEKGAYELLPYEQIPVAGNSRDVRAFVFNRNNQWYVVYWHISGEKKLQLPLQKSTVILYSKLGKKQSFSSNGNDAIVVPVSGRRYLTGKNLTKEALMKAFNESKIVE